MTHLHTPLPCLIAMRQQTTPSLAIFNRAWLDQVCITARRLSLNFAYSFIDVDRCASFSILICLTQCTVLHLECGHSTRVSMLIPATTCYWRVNSTTMAAVTGGDAVAVKSDDRRHKYIPLKDLKLDMGRINVAGVVNFFKQPQQSRGNDYFISFTLIDKTTPTNPMSTIVFHPLESKLPQIDRIGRVVLLRNVKVNTFSDNLQVVAYKFSTYLVFPPDSLSPISVSEGASLSKHDLDVVKALQESSSEDDDIVSSSKKLKRVCNVLPMDTFDMIGMVCNIHNLVEDRVVTLTLVDGTQPKFNCAKHIGSPDSNHCLEYSSLCVTIVVYDFYAIKGSGQLAPGDYIFLQNIKAGVVHGVLDNGDKIKYVQFTITTGERVTLCKLPGTDLTVKSIKKSLEAYKRVGQNSPRPPICYHTLEDRVTYNLHSYMRFSSVNEVICSTQVPTKYRMRVQPIDIRESSVEEVVTLYCKECYTSFEIPRTEQQDESGDYFKPGCYCTNYDCCIKQEDRESCASICYSYCLHITVADTTGELDVTVVGREGLVLLPNIRPCNLYLNREEREDVKSSLTRLFGCDPFRPKPDGFSAPWIDCNIYTFYPGGVSKGGKRKGNAHHTPSYRMFGTVLLPPV